MAATATLSRDATSVTIPLRQPSGGAPPITTDLGKPNQNIWEAGTINPRHLDQWSGLQQVNIAGVYLSDADYSTVNDLADLIKSYSGGSELQFTTSLDQFPDMKVAPAAGQDGALTIEYNSARQGVASVDLSLTRVERTQGSGSQDATTPTASGTGPIEISDGSTTVALETDVAVTRSVGRPNSTIRRSVDSYPIHIDKRKAASDTFELRAVYTDNTTTTITELANMFRQKLGSDSLTLDFNGLYDLGAFNVVPDGSQALRHDAPSGFSDFARTPTIQLRRVLA